MEAAAGIAGVEIVAAADCYKGHLDRARRAHLTRARGRPATTRQILARPDIDAVVIATPDHWHLKMTQEALAAGKHVYFEKPMTHSWEEGEAFIAAAEKSGKVVQVGSQYMSMGCARKAPSSSGAAASDRSRSSRARSTATPPRAPGTTRSRPTRRRRRSISRASSGPAPPRDFDLRRFFQWRLFWDYSGGLPTDLFVHLITATHS